MLLLQKQSILGTAYIRILKMVEFEKKYPVCDGPISERNKYCSLGCYKKDNNEDFDKELL